MSGLSPLVGLRLDGATITPWNDLDRTAGSLGRPVWGPTGLLEDLELRLGLPRDRGVTSIRAQCWARRLEVCAPRGRFYSRSFAVDRLGTAAVVLEWRDLLVMAGWDGAPISGGGPRLDALAELEATAVDVPPGESDRLARIGREIAETSGTPYESVTIAEDQALWPGRWRTVFETLARRGTLVRTLETPAPEGAPPGTMLAALQSSIAGASLEPPTTTADDSIIVLRAATSWELGEALAALLRAEPTESIALIRAGEAAALDAGLGWHGLAPLGTGAASPHRPILQVLPLALELAFEPRDPRRVLELLTLPVGPFRGRVGWWLARAVVEAPGIGGPRWHAEKERLAADLEARAEEPEAIRRRLARVAEWLERPGLDRERPAPKSALVEVARRVEEWLRPRLADVDDDPLLASAYGQARELRAALDADSRDELGLVEVRLLADRITASGAWVRTSEPRAGRIDHVDEPGALLSSRDAVVFWHAIAGMRRPPQGPPFDAAERAALERAGVRLPDASALLADEARASRRAVLAARRRLILAIPDVFQGRPTSPHPLWDEIVARLDLDEVAAERVTLTARRLRAERVATTELRGLDLPEASDRWHVSPGSIPRATRFSASSLEALLGCPLRWVLESAAGLRGGAAAALPPDHVLAGNLGHRLVERLFERGLLGGSREELETSARQALGELLAEEGATWLLPGRSFDREQWCDLLVRSVMALAEGLGASRLRAIAVEKEVSMSWGGRELVGRVDLLAESEGARPIVVDLKWGSTRYRKLLLDGAALQLAFYSRAAGVDAAAYYSLSTSRFMTVEPGLLEGVQVISGPSLASTWERALRTAAVIEETLERGEVPVTGVALSPGLLAALEVAEPDHGQHFVARSSPCEHCQVDALCGRRWERMP